MDYAEGESTSGGVGFGGGPLVKLGDFSRIDGTLHSKMVSYRVMRMRWRFILPVIGLVLFGVVSYSSFRFNRDLGTSPRKFYFWSSIRLDSDPQNRHHKDASPCIGCAWEPSWIWIDSGYLDKAFLLTALPAFALGAITVGSLARLGVSEVWTFAVVMPLLVFSWFYFVGWLIDRWVRKPPHPQPPSPG